MDNNGWIKLHRKLLDNPVMNRPKYCQLWITLLLLASHKESSFIWNGSVAKLKPGQLITGRKKLHDITGTAGSTIEDILRFLETQHQIRQQKTNKFRIITIENWDKYQILVEEQQQTDNQPTSSRHLADTFNNVKNDKNEKKSIPSEISSDDYTLETERQKAYNLLLNSMVDVKVAKRIAFDWKVPLESIENAAIKSELKAARDKTRSHNPAGYIVAAIADARNNGGIVKLSKEEQKLKDAHNEHN